jgi:site-specific DNA-methyltransferase (adenine-specific)
MGKGATEPTVIMSTEVASTDEHPVAKPIGWMLWSVRLASAEGDIILDSFAGSGTTGVAALRLGRRFIGIEKDPKYFRLACDRLRAEEQGSTLQAQRAGQEALFK